jgi:putative zinc finger protein
MDCKRLKDRLSDRALGGLDRPGEGELRAHLEACPDCRAALERERRLVGAIDRGVRAHLAAEPSPELAARVRMRLAEERAGSAAGLLSAWSLVPRWWLDWGLRPWIPATAAAVIALTAALVWLAHRPATRRAPAVASRTSSEAAQPQVEPVTPPVGPPSQIQAQSSSRRDVTRPRRSRERRAAAGASREEVLPEVIVDKNEQESIARLYYAIQAGRVDLVSLMAVPPGFKRAADGSLVPAPLHIPPVDVPGSDSESGWAQPEPSR